MPLCRQHLPQMLGQVAADKTNLCIALLQFIRQGQATHEVAGADLDGGIYAEGNPHYLITLAMPSASETRSYRPEEKLGHGDRKNRNQSALGQDTFPAFHLQNPS